MNVNDRLYSIDNKRIQKTIDIEDSLYNRLIELTKNKYDATISEIINICIENYIIKDNPSFYLKPTFETVTYRTIILRKNNIEALETIRANTGISFTRLLNASIKDFLDNL